MWLQVLVLVLVLGSGRCQDALQISVNSIFRANQSELVVRSGSALTVRCHGDGTLLRSSALRLSFVTLSNDLSLPRSTPRHTGTYSCSSANHSAAPPTSVHLYVSDPSVAFVVARSHFSAVEGEDFLFRCLPTDPDITNLTVQSQSWGRGLPPGMEVTFDPRRGALIRQVQRSFQGSYRCSGRRHGQEVMSEPIDLWVQHKLVAPPSLTVSDRAVIRLVGENFKVTCRSSNKNHFFTVNWTSPQGQVVTDSVSSDYFQSTVLMNRTLSLSLVQMSDSGLYTCTAVNEVGVATATTYLNVIEQPFIRVYLQLQNTSTDIIANISTDRALTGGGANVSVRGANNCVGGVSRVEVEEGRELTLTLVLEAYPPIRTQSWTLPEHIANSTVYTETHHTNDYRSEARLVIRRVHRSDRGLYSLLFSNDFFRGNTSLFLRVHYPPAASVTRLNHTVVCSGSGFPLPSLHWTSCRGIRAGCEDGVLLESTEEQTQTEEEEEFNDELMDEDEESVQRALSLRLAPGDDITVVCEAVNHMGRSHGLLQLHEADSLVSPFLIGSGSVSVVLLLLLLVAVWKWKQKPRYEIRWKIIESFDGNSYTFIDPTQLPYNQKWEFPRDKLRLGPVLGSGAFGKVVAATALGLGSDDNETTVAVKMLKARALSEERDALMSELKILSHIGHHHNIVNLLGACTTGGPMLMITEYCCHGDLLNFLRAQAQHFLCGQEAMYKNTRLRSDSGISCGSEYQEMKPILTPASGPDQVSGSDGASLSLLDLMRFSLEVAQGLDFLSSKNCIHRDIAARNVLLSERRVAKICDFGLARDIRNDDSYIVKGNARLPVKWMSPESIFHCVYTVQSDVWSYGVLLWEIFSLGRSPYPNIAVDTNFYKMIKDGRHMERPDFAPTEMYELMSRCWDLQPTLRPTFKTIGQLISRLLPSTNETQPHHSLQATYRNIDECQEEEEKQNQNQRDGGSEVDLEGPVRNIYQLS